METNAICSGDYDNGFETFFALPTEKKHRNHIIQAVLLCFVLYAYRALRVEMLRMDLDLFFILFFPIYEIVPFVGIFCWFVLLAVGLRTIWISQRNGLLIFVLVVGALFAWFMPEPPMREEIKLFFNRNRYEEVIAQGRLYYREGVTERFKLADENSDLSLRKYLYVAGNFMEFSIYPGTFSLIYSYDKNEPEGCGHDERVAYWVLWKKIDENWYICKRPRD